MHTRRHFPMGLMAGCADSTTIFACCAHAMNARMKGREAASPWVGGSDDTPCLLIHYTRAIAVVAVATADALAEGPHAECNE